MALERAKAFIEHVKKNESLQKTIRERQSNVLDIAREHGYEFDREHLDQAVREDRELEPTSKEDPDTCVCVP